MTKITLITINYQHLRLIRYFFNFSLKMELSIMDNGNMPNVKEEEPKYGPMDLTMKVIGLTAKLTEKAV